MSIDYRDIARAVALRAKQITDGDATARETAYTAASLTANMDGIDVPYSALKKDILSVEKELALLIGNSNNPQFREHLKAKSGNLADKAEIPLTDNGSKEFIGTFDGVFDAVDDHPLRKQPQILVVNRITNPGSFFKGTSYLYCIEGTIIRHTRTNVYFRGCSWDWATQEALYNAFNSTSLSPLPQEMAVLWMCRVLAQLPQEGWFVSEAGYYGQLVQQRQMEIIEGKIRLMQMPVSPKAELK